MQCEAEMKGRAQSKPTKGCSKSQKNITLSATQETVTHPVPVSADCPLTPLLCCCSETGAMLARDTEVLAYAIQTTKTEIKGRVTIPPLPVTPVIPNSQNSPPLTLSILDSQNSFLPPPPILNSQNFLPLTHRRTSCPFCK